MSITVNNVNDQNTIVQRSINAFVEQQTNIHIRQERCVYVSLGQNVPLSRRFLDYLFTATLDQCTVVSIPNYVRDLLPTIIPDHVLVLDQPLHHLSAFHQLILSQPSIDLFISHCSIGEARIAMLESIPILCLPRLADQFDVANRLAKQNAAVVFRGSSDPALFQAEIMHMMNDYGCFDQSQRQWAHERSPYAPPPCFYHESAQAMGKSLEQMGGLQRASKLIEAMVDHDVKEIEKHAHFYRSMNAKCASQASSKLSAW
eukprot:CAMPEP_0201558348 /NCGR_PEP_ID=MMETSP0173_2-20130828/67304_1 /ASSEMBLY_ACC=CAM_ASM_000268 /TAXON_ID=218659 /ORGANISM="Vexillifera sp., Strain DIVA3 564/2" /LENGTH=258 /DNA_ID=CAMNT_0047971703 /DNA_START=29 /DNA_END=802 /DNA_ORIENTATION=-